MIYIIAIYVSSIIMLLFTACFYDMRDFRIPNRLNAMGILSGLMYSIVSGGIKALEMSIVGLFIPILLLFVMFGFHVVGAGDIKLLAAIGSFTGLLIIRILVFTFLITALWGIASVTVRFITKSLNGFTRMHLSLPIAVSTISLVLVSL